MNRWKKLSGDFEHIAGFRSAGACGGIKKSGKSDMALIVADEPVVSAACFTKNKAAAASVAYCREVLGRPLQRAIVANSGNANCCTGESGMRDTRRMAKIAAEFISCSADEVFVCSTGVIGVPMPMDKVQRGIELAAGSLDGPEVSAAQAILTTDLVLKNTAYAHDSGYHIAGICKGSGMVHPNMATMLAFVLADVGIDKKHLQEITDRAVQRSFNRISVDNDESTNDTVIIMSSARSSVRLTTAEDYAEFESMLTFVFQDLAKQIVRDGEGATTFVEVSVSGCKTEADANQIAMTICDSMLVKTAIAGRDPNWGRIVAAAGYSGVDFQLDDLQVYLNEVLIFSNGSGHDDHLRPFTKDGEVISRAALKQSMKDRDQQDIVLRFAEDGCSATRWTSDLTHGYITINADYTT